MSDGRLYFCTSRSSAWQRPQVTLETRAGFTSEPGSAGARIACSPWQSVQTGAPASPRETASPWMLPANALWTSSWHWPQVSGTFQRLMRDAVSFALPMSCAPWQSEQEAAPSLPPASARPWTLFS